MEQMAMPMGTPPRPTAVTPNGTPGRNSNESNDYSSDGSAGDGGDDPLLDLAQLEELHHEAERMKALGNKHMAAQVRELNFWNGWFGSVPFRTLSNILQSRKF